MTITKKMQSDALSDISRAKEDLDERAARWSNADIETNAGIDDATASRKYMIAEAADSALRAAMPAAISAAEARLDAAKEEAGESKKIPPECKDGDSPGEKIDRVLEMLDAITKRQDAINGRMDALEKGKEEDGAEAAMIDRKKKDAEGPFGGGKEGSGNSEKGDPKEMTADRKDAYLDRYDTDESRDLISDIQSKSEQIFSAFGDSVPRPMQNETAFEYERRVSAKLQKHSKDWAGRDLRREIQSPDVMKIVGQQIRDSAWQVATSNDHPGIPDGGLRAVRRVDPNNGCRITEYYGKPSSWMSQFSGGRRLAKFNLHRIKNYPNE